MGFFSYKCAKSKLSIPAYPYAELLIELSDVVILTIDGRKARGIYGGYGDIKVTAGDESLAGFMREDAWHLGAKLFPNESKMRQYEKTFFLVRQDLYNNETFDDLAKTCENRSCPEQGYFYEDDTLRTLILVARGIQAEARAKLYAEMKSMIKPKTKKAKKA